MSAIDTIQALLKLGVAVKDAYTNAQQANGGINWATFMTSPQFATIQGDVNDLVAKLTKTDLDGAIDAIQKKETALLNGRSIVDLSGDEVLQYSDLVHTESLLTNRAVQAVTPTSQALSWVVDTLLPTLVTAAKIIIPILV